MDKGTKASLAFFAVAAGGGAYMWWKGKQMARPPLNSAAKSGATLVQVTTSRIELIPPKLMSVSQVSRAKVELINVANRLYKPTLPTFSLLAKNIDESRLHKGLLGKIVGAYWGYSHTKVWYMTRCGQYHPFDDTAQWLARNVGHHFSKENYKKHMAKDTGYWPIAVHASFSEARLTKNPPSDYKHYRRLTSLDRTFPNWSMPFGGYTSVFGQGGVVHGSYKKGGNIYTGDCWMNIGSRRRIAYDSALATHSSCSPDHDKYLNDYPKKFIFGQWADFFDTKGNFDGNAVARSIVLSRGYKYTGGPAEDRKVWAEVVEQNRQFLQVKLPNPVSSITMLDLMSGYPGRIWGKVQTIDRAKATYNINKIPKEFVDLLYKSNITKEENTTSIKKEFNKQLEQYYACGYNLVNTVLDVLIDRGHPDLEHEFPSFVKHCNWWFIAPPDKTMLRYVLDKDGELVRMPRLSDIGASPAGLYDISSADLVDYVMKITPRPGTIPPWLDKGPCWMWPKTLGQLTPHGAPATPPLSLALRSSEISKWSSWGTSATYLLQCVNDAVYDYVMNAAGGALSNAAVDVAKEVSAEWVKSLSADMLSKLEDDLGSAYRGVKKLASEIATFASVVENVNLATSLNDVIGLVPIGSINIYDTLKKYLVDSVDGVSDTVLNPLKNRLTNQLDELRSWGWQDDLLGDFSSLGSKFGSVRDARSNFGFDYNPIDDRLPPGVKGFW